MRRTGTEVLLFAASFILVFTTVSQANVVPISSESAIRIGIGACLKSHRHPEDYKFLQNPAMWRAQLEEKIWKVWWTGRNGSKTCAGQNVDVSAIDGKTSSCSVCVVD